MKDFCGLLKDFCGLLKDFCGLLKDFCGAIHRPKCKRFAVIVRLIFKFTIDKL